MGGEHLKKGPEKECQPKEYGKAKILASFKIADRFVHCFS